MEHCSLEENAYLGMRNGLYYIINNPHTKSHSVH